MRTGAALLALVVWALGAGCGWARGPVVVVLLPGTSLTQWRRADAPSLHRLMRTGALAVMNTRTARLLNDRRREPPESAALTLGAGSRAAGGTDVTQFLPANAVVPGVGVPAGALFQRRTGNEPPALPASNGGVKLPSPRNGRGAGGEGLANPAWPRVWRANQDRGYDLLPGNLGDALSSARVTVEAGGGPLAAPVACRSEGTVKAATDPLRTGPDTCVVWDAGADVPAADALIARAAAGVTRTRGRLILVSPCVGDGDYQRGRRLAPVLVWGPGVPPGLLTSSSTRRAGLVTNTDFAPSAAAWFGAALPVAPFGHAWRSVPATDAVGQVQRLEEAAYRQEAGMRLLPGIAVFLGLWMLLGASLGSAGRFPPWMSVPPLWAVLTVTVSRSLPDVALWGALSAALMAAAYAWQGARRTVLLATGFEAAILPGDLCAGDPLLRHSLLGYSAVEGARYYGMGNEAMGALVGACLVLVVAAWPRARRWGRAALAAGLLAVTVLLGSPAGGAKAGGVLVCGIAFGILLLLLRGRRWGARTILPLLLLPAAVLGLIAWTDAHLGGAAASHLGQAVARIERGGWREGWDTIIRKWAVEGRLSYHSAWACPLWVGLGALVLSTRRTTSPYARTLAVAGLTAMAACLAANDAGVVAGALCAVIVWSGAASLDDTQRRRAPEAMSNHHSTMRATALRPG